MPERINLTLKVVCLALAALLGVAVTVQTLLRRRKNKRS